MLVLTIKTDQPNSEIGLYKDQQKIDYVRWLADRQLSETILKTLTDLISKNDLELKDINGIVVYEGPGSFTGLRIGITVANTLAYGLNAAIVGSSEDDWISRGINKLTKDQNEKIVKPLYGAEPNITSPRK